MAQFVSWHGLKRMMLRSGLGRRLRCPLDAIRRIPCRDVFCLLFPAREDIRLLQDLGWAFGRDVDRPEPLAEDRQRCVWIRPSWVWVARTQVDRRDPMERALHVFSRGCFRSGIAAMCHPCAAPLPSTRVLGDRPTASRRGSPARGRTRFFSRQPRDPGRGRTCQSRVGSTPGKGPRRFGRDRAAARRSGNQDQTGQARDGKNHSAHRLQSSAPMPARSQSLQTPSSRLHSAGQAAQSCEIPAIPFHRVVKFPAATT